MSNRQTIINQILYWSYRYQLRDIPFEWENKPFDPKIPKDMDFLQRTTIDILIKILEKYKEKHDILNQYPDDQIYRNKKISLRNSNNKYNIRKKCMFCGNILLNMEFFKKDYKCPVAHYVIDKNNESQIIIPFNIFLCKTCGIAQTKYLGDLNEIYKKNHADSTGTIMRGLHKKTANMIMKYEINNIIEIGSSYGVLADTIIDEYNKHSESHTLKYNVIEPCFRGDRNNKIIYDNFYEEVDDTKINANTFIMSHVLEHIYEPIQILEKIEKNKNIKYFLLVFPDLEYYIKNQVLHVLNTEHIYYIENEKLIKKIENFGFQLLEKEYYMNHSVILLFQREPEPKPITNIHIKNMQICEETYYKTQQQILNNYFCNIQQKVNAINQIIKINPTKQVYLWPASIHTFYLCIFEIDMGFYGFLDNSINKIGKLAYGLNKKIYNFKEISEENNENTIIVLNGGVFNIEIEDYIKKYDKIEWHKL